MSNRVILTGFHFPPSSLSSGHLRTLAFAKYLPGFGWDPLVLTATKCAYEQVDIASIESVPVRCRVFRTPALDAKRHLGIRGKYPSVLARPDRWASWWPAAVWRGLRLIRQYRANAIWSTYPIMTSHCVAFTLHRLTGIPWIADFRDPVAMSVAGKPALTVASQTRWESRVLSRAACSVFTTPGAKQWCAEQHPELDRQGRLMVIGNGYDDDEFAGLPTVSRPLTGRPLMMVHSGVLYPDGRNPLPFFTALASLHAAGHVGPGGLKIVLRASGSDATYAREIERLGLGAMVELAPPVSRQQALVEQAEADALLLFQGTEYDRQIPAKLYEYIRIGRPIFALVGERGDTTALLRETGGAELALLDNVGDIETRLRAFIQALHSGTAPQISQGEIARHSRREGAALLASLLDRVAAPRVAPVRS